MKAASLQDENLRHNTYDEENNFNKCTLSRQRQQT
jgi:hypothetical protein